MTGKEKINATYQFTFRNDHGPESDAETGSVYFIGIGGIGMSAIARFFKTKGLKVSGYDKTPTDLTKQLEAEGVQVYYDENVERIPKAVSLVVYTPAIPADHKELVYYRDHGYNVVKRSDVLQLITSSSFNICVAGTHGKTTITTMIAHLLRDTGFGCNAFLGGIAANYASNYWADDRNVCVVEADEYDRSFLKLNPDIAIITAMDADHLDIYGTADNMEQAFIEFGKRVAADGQLIAKFGLKRTEELRSPVYKTYSLQNESADIHASNIKIKHGGYEFDIILPDKIIENVRLNMGGMHNVENAVAAVAAISSLEIPAGKIRSAIESFRGVKRRFEYVLKNDRVVFVDDYAHHPEELRALITGAKTLFRERKCTVIFQPHLYSRTRDLADGFAEALDMADEVIVLPVYPARELPIPGVSSEMITERMKLDNKRVMTKEEMLEWVTTDFVPGMNEEFGSLLITAGAGDIDMLVQPIKMILETI